MILFLKKHPENDEIIKARGVLNMDDNTYKVTRSGSQYDKDLRVIRYWLEAVDMESGELQAMEYELY